MKILLAIDGSDYTKRMLAYVAAHDETFGGAAHEYVIATVAAPIPSHVTQYLPKGTVESFHAEQAEQVLEPVRAFAKQNGWNARFVHVVGPAAESIASLADKERVDLVVMGSHGHTALGGLLLGSVATGVLARCRTPVLIIR